MTRGLKDKTIRSILNRKIGAWLDTLPEDMRKDVRNDTIVTGGSIASMLMGDPVNDFDIYFKTKETTLKVANLYVERFKEARAGTPMWVEEIGDLRGDPRVRIVVESAGVESENGSSDYRHFETRPESDAGDYVSEIYDDAKSSIEADEADEKPPYRPVFLSSNAITLAGKIQIILRFYGEPDEIHENYDFAHCTSYWTASDGALTIRPEAMRAILARTLVYRGSRYPVASLIRTRKFIERGWKINAGQYVKMALQIGKLDLTDYKVLEDQLTGVDVAYFSEVLQRVKENNPEKIESAYLIEIIDRMFGD